MLGVRIQVCLLLGLMLLWTLPAAGDWITKDGWVDYSQHKVGNPPQVVRADGMPDFDQKQNGWSGIGNPPQWNYCGPVAAANCLWWFDSKMEMVKCISLPPGSQVSPPAISDHYPLVHEMTGSVLDDHNPANVIPWIDTLVTYLPMGVVPNGGITAADMQAMIDNYLRSPLVDLWGHFQITHVMQPTFTSIYAQTDSSQDQILLLGFWQLDTLVHYWYRFAGHWVTVAGVDTQNGIQQISFSDPIVDMAEGGSPGAVWDGWQTPHGPLGTHASFQHNDAGSASHDWYTVQASPSPGGVIAAAGYGSNWDPADWQNFDGQNSDPRWGPRYRPYQPNVPVHTEIEEIVMVCPKFDYGDLTVDVPTIDITSCGPAHPLTEKAWLGSTVTAEAKPRIYNCDNGDDGVTFLGLPWASGRQCTVWVAVTAGALYAGEQLFISAWIDGNNDGDFDDGPALPRDDSLNYSEWGIHDVPVAGNVSYQFVFRKPGLGSGSSPTVMRFRLSSVAAGRFGYGGYWGGGASNGWGTFDIDWTLGEVEDYSHGLVVPSPPVPDLRIWYPFAGEPPMLYWTAPVEGMYFIYSTTNPNNHGDPPGTGWVLEYGPVFMPAGPQMWMSPAPQSAVYKNYVVKYESLQP